MLWQDAEWNYRWTESPAEKNVQKFEKKPVAISEIIANVSFLKLNELF